MSQTPRRRVRATPRRENRPPAPGSRFLSGIVGANIRALRRGSGLNQKTMAARMRQLGHPTFSRATVSDVERATRTLSVDELLSLAMILGVDLADLLNATGPVDFGGGLAIPAAVMVEWVHGRVTIQTTGPAGYMVIAKPGFEDAVERITAARQAVDSASADEIDTFERRLQEVAEKHRAELAEFDDPD